MATAKPKSHAILRKRNRRKVFQASERLIARVSFAACRLCGIDLPPDMHASSRYHKDCKIVIRRQQKRSCWHRNKDIYAATARPRK